MSKEKTHINWHERKDEDGPLPDNTPVLVKTKWCQGKYWAAGIMESFDHDYSSEYYINIGDQEGIPWDEVTHYSVLENVE